MDYDEGIPTFDRDSADKSFIIDRAAPPVTKNRDPLTIRINPSGGAGHFARQQGPVYQYAIVNQKNGHRYAVHFFLSGAGSIVATCDCPARKVCKHIARSWAIHRTAIEAGFVEDFPEVEDDYANDSL